MASAPLGLLTFALTAMGQTLAIALLNCSRTEIAALIAIRTQFPTLEKALGTQDAQKSYTTLILDDCDRLPAMDKHITNLADLFIRNDADRVFGVHLDHGHFETPKGITMLGTNFANLKPHWANATGAESFGTTSVDGHVFGFYERSMSELILDQGTVMLGSSAVRNTLNLPTQCAGRLSQ
ncbi:hypothetical protein O1611_g2919 [Lasiodiplodia mahajangana]|uniref:Uncharacterized protein n=1 Tax=Lasiodiplodia mahajangana TaxID=1108764 RepID=A0ACC2JTW9_9PEZI|nr:hypothetical protein O1611_g2919 [Lasiodiplodia mahajangana]